MSRARSRKTTPAADLLHHTLVDSTESYRKCKVILDVELKRIGSELKRSDLVPAARASLLLQLLEIQRALGQDVKSIGQLVAAKPSSNSGDTSGGGTQSVSDIMSELVDGRKRRG
jgi:hypothetical protein